MFRKIWPKRVDMFSTKYFSKYFLSAVGWTNTTFARSMRVEPWLRRRSPYSSKNPIKQVSFMCELWRQDTSYFMPHLFPIFCQQVPNVLTQFEDIDEEFFSVLITPRQPVIILCLHYIQGIRAGACGSSIVLYSSRRVNFFGCGERLKLTNCRTFRQSPLIKYGGTPFLKVLELPPAPTWNWQDMTLELKSQRKKMLSSIWVGRYCFQYWTQSHQLLKAWR